MMYKKRGVLFFLNFFFLSITMTACGILEKSTDKNTANIDGSRLPQQRKLNVEAAVKAHLTAGVGYLETGEMSSAHRHLKRALELDESAVEVHNTLAIFYQKERDKEQEEKHFKRALELDENNPQVKHNFGSSLCRNERFDEARKLLTEAASNYSYGKRASSYENLGRCELRSGHKDKAEIAFENAYRLNKRLPQTLLALSKLSLEKGEAELSYRYYKEYLTFSMQTAASLWMGIQLERIFGDQDALASYELALRNRYPGSTEHQQYLKSSK